jgi:predicted RNase H-like HicB family nuclease
MARNRPFDPATTYTIEAVRSGKWWALSVPELPGIHSQVRRLDQAEAMIRDALALAYDIDPDTPRLCGPVPTINPELDDLLHQTREHRAQLVELRRETDELTRRLVREMSDAGLPVRDIAVTLDISFQRAAQLAKAG